MRRVSLLLLLAALAGCASTPGPEAEATADLSGTFRGRWWNYYERGRLLLDTGHYAEAEADLNVALRQRPQDQRWARTYGLHFVPEYFPQREMGITQFHLGNLDEAERLLRDSLSQEKSALAGHYLNVVRAAKIDTQGGDATPPQIDAIPFSTTSALESRLHATIRDAGYVARVSVNGEPHVASLSAETVLTLDAPVTLRPGDRSVIIEATDLSGNTATVSVPVSVDTDGPSVSFDLPLVVPGEISGTLYDPAGAALLVIGEAPAVIEGTMFRAALSSAAATTFEARDSLGNVTTGTLPLPRTTHAALQTDQGFVLAQAMAPNALQVSMPNLADGQRYLMDEIVVTVEASAAAPLESLELDGVPLPIVPGARSMTISRRIPLEAMGERTITATARAGAESESASATISRIPTAVELPEERLRVALLGNLWEGAGPRLEGEAAFVADELARAIFDGKRFDLISRDAMPRVLEEQELRTVLGSRSITPALRQIVPADLLTVGKVRRTGDTVEIVLHAVSSESSSIMGYADVAGEVKTLDDLRSLARDLALRFEQEFPRAHGTVVNAAGDRAFTTLAQPDRVRPELPCVVYRLGDSIIHPETGAVLGRSTEIVARGRLDEVQPRMSRVALEAGGAGAVQVNDDVVAR